MKINKRKSTEEINETRIWFLEKINKISKLLAELTTKKKKKKTQTTNTSLEKGVIIKDPIKKKE